MHFTKMHGLGNDYLYVYSEVPENIEELSIKLSDRHFGAGSDGMIYICESKVADFRMRIFNADGSEAKMCGNGIRCVGKYVYDKGYTDKKKLTIETESGIKELELHVVNGKVKKVKVNMGKAFVDKDKKITAGGEEYTLVPVNVGNPHAVIFVKDVEAIDLAKVGPLIEHHEEFPGGVNIEFVQVLSDSELRMRVWERGSGITMACGTGACATTAAAVHRGFCEADSHVLIRLDGGPLEIRVSSENDITMAGPAELVYEGDVEL